MKWLDVGALAFLILGFAFVVWISLIGGKF